MYFRANFLPGPAMWISRSRAAKIHRRLFWCFRPSRARFLAISNALLCVFAWFLAVGWWKLYSFNCKSSDTKSKIPFIDQLYIVFWIGVAPESYLLLDLSRHPKSEWLSFVFPREQIHWHAIQAPILSQSSHQRLTNKKLFSEFLRENEIESVPDSISFNKGHQLEKSDVFNQLPKFKPSLHSLCLETQTKH